MEHEKGHGHGHGSSAPGQGLAFGVGIGLNIIFVIVEATYGVMAGSMALVADAAHNLSDVLGLALAWGAIALAARKPTQKRTYGLRKTTVLSALTNAVLLLVAVGGITWEAVGRFSHPGPVQGLTVMVVAAVGVVINGVSAWFFARGQKGDVNIRGAFLHLAADAAVSVGVVIAGLVVLKTGWVWLDPAVSIGISLVVLLSTWGLLRESLNLALDAVPEGIELERIRAYLLSLPDVQEVHDLHVWAMSTTEVALTAHLVVGNEVEPHMLTKAACEGVHEKFEIEHTTIQVELAGAHGPCQQARAGAV